MKKVISIIGIIVSLAIFITSIYILFKIYFVFSNIDEQLYDGFGYPYNNNEPSSPYMILGVGGFVGGISLFKFCLSKFKK